MKRRDLAPGAYFRYVVNPRHVYWVQACDASGRKLTTPEGVLASGPNPVSDDWERDVVLVEGTELAEALKLGEERVAAAKAAAEAAATATTMPESDDDAEEEYDV